MDKVVKFTFEIEVELDEVEALDAERLAAILNAWLSAKLYESRATETQNWMRVYARPVEV